MIHQGSELYGSDRSFLSSIESFSPSINDVSVILPNDGDLTEYVKEKGANVSFYEKGILRKKELKNPFKFITDFISACFFYGRIFARYDVIYINTLVLIAPLFVSFFFSKRKKIYCHVREIPSGTQKLFFKSLLWFSRASLIFNSFNTKDSLGLEGLVVHNGVEPLNSCVQIAFKSRTKVHFLLIGRINSWKGQNFFVDSLALLPKQIRERLRVDIVGGVFPGQEMFLDELISKVSQSDVDINIHPFTKDISSFVSNCDYLVVPSLNPEPFGRVAIESFSLGKPVIAAKHGGLIEIVEDSVTGLFFSPADMDSLSEAIITSVNKDELEYQAMSKAALDSYNSSFSEDIYIKKLADALKA